MNDLHLSAAEIKSNLQSLEREKMLLKRTIHNVLADIEDLNDFLAEREESLAVIESKVEKLEEELGYIESDLAQKEELEQVRNLAMGLKKGICHHDSIIEVLNRYADSLEAGL